MDLYIYPHSVKIPQGKQIAAGKSVYLIRVFIATTCPLAVLESWSYVAILSTTIGVTLERIQKWPSCLG